MIDDDLRGYQTAETAWRYNSQIGRLSTEIAHFELELAVRKARLNEIQKRPPLYHLFNWSA